MIPTRRSAFLRRKAGLTLLLAGTLAAPALAETAPAKSKERSSALSELGSNKEPIKIDSDRLDVFDKEGRAVFAGNVVAVQGDSTMRCTTLNVFYEQARGTASGGGAKTSAKTAEPGSAPAAATAPSPAPSAGGGMGGNSSIKKIDCRGPVTIVSKTQVATGDNAEFDRVANKVYLLGNVALSDGPNVTRGERLVYDLNSGRANVETKPGGRVRALFVPGSTTEKPGAEKSGQKKPQR